MIASRRTIVPLAALAMLAAAAAPAFAADGDGDGDFTLTAAVGTGGNLGSRSVTTVTPATLVTSLNSSVATGSLAVVVTETARTGTTPWSVTAQASDLSDTATTPNVLAKSNLTISGRSVTAVPTTGLGGPSADTTNGVPLGTAAATLFSNAGQSNQAIYTGVYTATSTMNLAIPNGTAVGTYSGLLTITLVQ